MGGGSAVGSSQQPLPGGSGGDACRTSRARSCIIACGHAPLRAVCIAAVCKLPTDLASRWWFLRCRRLVAAARRRQRRRGRAEPRARGHTSLRSALRAVMHRARSCIIACGHAVAYLLSSRAVAPPAAARSSPSLTAARSSRSSTAASRVRTRPLRYCARSSHRCAVMHHGSVVGSMRAVAAPALAVRRGRRLLRNHARCGCPRAGREARAKAAP